MSANTKAEQQPFEVMCQEWRKQDLELPDGSSVDFFNFVDQEWGAVEDIEVLKGAAKDRLEEIWKTAQYWARTADRFAAEAIKLKAQLNISGNN